VIQTIRRIVGRTDDQDMIIIMAIPLVGRHYYDHNVIIVSRGNIGRKGPGVRGDRVDIF